MADIELVIKIDEEYIEQIDKLKFLIGGIEDRSLQINVINAIMNGIPLPKGHGRLIDEREVYKKFYCRCLAKAAKEVLDGTSTIIEADTESEEQA